MTFVPAGSSVTSPTLNLTIEWCDNRNLAPGWRNIVFNGQVVTSSFTYQSATKTGCTAFARSVGTLTLRDGVNTVDASIRDATGNIGSNSTTYRLSSFRVTAVSASHLRRVRANTTNNVQSFVVENLADSGSFTVTPSCSGSAVATCWLDGTSPIVLNKSATATVNVRFNAGATTGSTGTINLIVASSLVSAARDTGWTDVEVVAARAPGLDVSATTTPRVIERDLCLTIAAGSAAAYECGDLRIVHGIPGVRTFNKVRAPTLHYNSQHAHPYVLVSADYTLAPSAGVPDSVVAQLFTLAGASRARMKWPGSNWSPDSTRRITIGFDALGDSTNYYTYRLVATRYHSSGSVSDTALVNVIVVNRAGSPFGAGWWLAGLERLIHLPDGNKLWIGGDGSARVYQAVVGQPGVWRADNVDRPDSLRAEGAEFVRDLPQRITVRFDASGRHVKTVTRLGHETRFLYSGSSNTLASIRVPRWSNDSTFVFGYVSGQLRTVTAPAPHAGAPAQVVTLTNTGGNVTDITDPNGTIVRFVYGGVARQITGRRDRRDTLTTYTYDAGQKLASYAVSFTGGPVTTRFTTAETRGFPTAQSPNAVALDSTYTLLQGPRTNVADDGKFWLDRFGAPMRIRNAIGRETLLDRANAAWPALVTRIKYANRRAVSATYDSFGRLQSSIDSGTNVQGQYATTRVWWNPTWESADSIVDPAGVFTKFGYDARGNRSLQQVTHNAARAVTFGYDSLGMLETVDAPLTPPQTIKYDLRGNVRMTVSAVGYRTLTYMDAVGRDTLTIVPIDTISALDSAQLYLKGQRQRVAYNRAGLDSLSESIGPAVSYSVPPLLDVNLTTAPETLSVEKTFDPEGYVLWLRRRSKPDPAAIGWATTQWRYDAAGRKTHEIAPDGYQDVTTFDEAGNVIRHLSRRLNTDTMEYDAANRLTRRVIPRVQKSYSQAICSPGCQTWTFPRYPNGGSNLQIAADTATFAYDAMGNIALAYNGDARVVRRYFPNGALAHDTLRIRSVTGTNFTYHIYGLTYGYDIAGRRIWLKHPANIAPRVSSQLKDSTAYAYDTTGALVSIRDPLGNLYRFVRDLEGRLDTVALPGGVYETRSYDVDGRPRQRQHFATRFVGDGTDSSYASGTNGRYYLQNDAMTYDAQDRVLTTLSLAIQRATLYDGLGALVRVRHWANPQRWHRSDQLIDVDALGNRTRIRTIANFGMSLKPSADSTSSFYATDGTGRHTASQGIGETYNNTHGDTLEYDLSGNQIRRHEWTDALSPQQHTITESVLFYDAAERLRVADRRHCIMNSTRNGCATSVPPLGYEGSYYDRGAYEEYRYDALGRRIWIRTRQDSTCYSNCVSVVKRVIWDGDEILYEIRYPASDSLEGAAPELLERDTALVSTGFHGRVSYVNGLGIDKPLGIIRIGYTSLWPAPFLVVPHYDWRGAMAGGTFDVGTAKRCTNYQDLSTCIRIDWPAEALDPYFSATLQAQAGPISWAGDHIEEMRDASGFLYRRNRYYDPGSGRFTQEDPIGIAGGLNVYGFAKGDPVNYSDPFGLCPLCAVYAVFEVGASLYDAYDLAKTAIGYARGKVSKTELGITAAGAGAGIFGFGGGYGKLGREAASRLIRDVSDNPSNWKVVGTFTEAAINKKAKGGVSIQTIVENEAGDRLVRHTVIDKSGKILDDHYRPMFKPRDVDRQ